MSYQDFLDTLISPIRLFASALSQVADSLIHNYIIITLLGLALFISLVWLLYYTFHDFIERKISRIEDKLDRYKDYELYKEVQSEYLKKHRVDEFMYLYDLTILKQQVMNGIYRNNPEVLLDNITQFNKLKAQALKNIKKDYESDDNPNNDDDIDYIIPTPPIQKASVGELKHAQQNSWLKEYSQDLEEQIVNNVDRIMHENHDLLLKRGLSYDKKNNVFFDIKTGEVVNIPDKFDKKHNLFNFDEFDKFDFQNVKRELDLYYRYYNRVHEQDMSKSEFFQSTFGFSDLDDLHLTYKEQMRKFDLPISSFSEYLKDYFGLDINEISNYQDLEDV